MPQIILMEGRLLGLGLPSTRFQGRPPRCVMGPRGFASHAGRCSYHGLRVGCLWS